MFHALRVSSRIQDGQVAGGRVRQQVHAVQAEVGAQRFHITGQPVAAVAERVAGICGLPGAAGVRHDQLPRLAQPAQITEVLAGPARAAGQAHQRRPGPEDAVADLGAVIGSEPRHMPIMPGPRGSCGRPAR